MPCVEKGKAKKLNLVKLEGPLGDLSGMTTAERAEIVQQDGRRRIFEEIAQAEAKAWRGGCCGVPWSRGASRWRC